MADNDTPWCGVEASKLYLQSGQFTSTLKTSEDVSAVDAPWGITWDGTNSPWSGNTNDKLYLQSGQFTSTLKDSEDVSAVDLTPAGISWDGTNTPWVGTTDAKLYLQSGQFTSTIKDSESVNAIDTFPSGISWDGVNTPWSGNTDDKLYLQSGQFTSTLKTSLSVGAVDTSPSGISWDGVNTPWSGNEAKKLYLQSGQFTSTIKDSEDVSAVDANILDTCTNQIYNRLNSIEEPDPVTAVVDTVNPEIAVRSAIFLIGESSTDISSFVQLYPDYSYTFTKVKDHVDNRTLSGKMYSYTFSTYDEFEIPESWVSSENRVYVNSLWLSNTNLEFYTDYNIYPNSYYNVRITNTEEPYPNFIKPYFKEFFEGTLNLGTYD